MLEFLRRKLPMFLMVTLTVSIIGFGMLRLSGDLASSIAGENATDAQVAEVAHRYGLDRPLPLQYLSWVGGLLKGDLGTSLFTQEPVMKLLADRIGVTVTLAVLGLALGLAVAVPLGAIAAIRQNTVVDRLALVAGIFGQAIPNFWFSLILIYLFGVAFRILPIAGSDTPAHFVMPVLVLATTVMPALMRVTRAGMIDVLESDYVRTAWAKGLSGPVVLFKHALRNAILPVVSLAAVSLGNLLAGSVVVESVFGMNGIGLLAYNSVLRMDFPVVQAILVMASFAYVLLTFLADMLNAWLDPRVVGR